MKMATRTTRITALTSPMLTRLTTIRMVKEMPVILMMTMMVSQMTGTTVASDTTLSRRTQMVRTRSYEFHLVLSIWFWSGSINIWWRETSHQTELLLIFETPWNSMELHWSVWSRVRALGSIFDRSSNMHVLNYGRKPLTNFKKTKKKSFLKIFLFSHLTEKLKVSENISNSLNFKCLKKLKGSCFKTSYHLKIKREKIWFTALFYFEKQTIFQDF